MKLCSSRNGRDTPTPTYSSYDEMMEDLITFDKYMASSHGDPDPQAIWTQALASAAMVFVAGEDYELGMQKCLETCQNYHGTPSEIWNSAVVAAAAYYDSYEGTDHDLEVILTVR